MRALLIALTCAAATLPWAGCCDIEIPAATIGQMANPEWARNRISADVCYRFPECKFASPEEEREFKEIVGEINRIGGSLRPALKKGEIAPDEFVGYEIILEFFAAQLLAFCEESAGELREPAKGLVLAYADRVGMRQDVDRIIAAGKGARLKAMSPAVQSLRVKVQGGR